MPSSSRQQSHSEALNQEATNLRAIAERLGTNIERFEAFMASHEATDHAASREIPALRGETSGDCEQLARKLQEERKHLIAAWEQLERDQRNLLKTPELLKVSAESAPPQPKTKSKTESTALPPVMPCHTDSETNISKRLQFQHLQREIDRRR